GCARGEWPRGAADAGGRARARRACGAADHRAPGVVEAARLPERIAVAREAAHVLPVAPHIAAGTLRRDRRGEVCGARDPGPSRTEPVTRPAVRGHREERTESHEAP